MAHIFQEMSPGMVTMASTDKDILIYDVLGLKTGIFYIQTCLWTKRSKSRKILAIKNVLFFIMQTFIRVPDW